MYVKSLYFLLPALFHPSASFFFSSPERKVFWQQLPARRQPPFVYVVRLTTSAAGDNERWWVAFCDTCYWKKHPAVRIAFSCTSAFCAVKRFVVVVVVFVFFCCLTLVCESSPFEIKTRQTEQSLNGGLTFSITAVSWGVTSVWRCWCNQLLCFHTFSFFFFHVPPPSPLILRLSLETKKAALTKRPNEKELFEYLCRKWPTIQQYNDEWLAELIIQCFKSSKCQLLANALNFVLC